MKKLLILAVVLLAVTLSAGSALAATLTVRADNWPPFNGDPKSAKPGYMIEVLKAIFEPQGVQVDYQTMPWNRSKDEVKSGKYDAMVGADNDEAAGYVVPKESFGKFSNCFFVAPSSGWRFQGVDSLKQVKLGVIEGYSYDEQVNAYIKGAPQGKVIAATGDDALPKLIKMLQAGRIDAVLEDASVLNAALMANNVPAGQVVLAGKLGDTRDLNVAFSPAKDTSRKYSEQFSAGIVELRKSGKLKQILDRYSVKDWK